MKTNKEVTMSTEKKEQDDATQDYINQYDQFFTTQQNVDETHPNLRICTAFNSFEFCQSSNNTTDAGAE